MRGPDLVHCLGAVVIASGVTLIAGEAVAHPQVRVGWRGPDGCPDRVDVDASISRYVGDELLRETVEAHGDVSEREGRWQLVLRVRRGAVTVTSRHEGPDCDALATVMAERVVRDARALAIPGTSYRKAPQPEDEDRRPAVTLPRGHPDRLPPCNESLEPCPGNEVGFSVSGGASVPHGAWRAEAGVVPAASLRTWFADWLTRSWFYTVVFSVGPTLGTEVGVGARFAGTRALHHGSRWIALGTVGVYGHDFNANASAAVFGVRGAVRYEGSYNILFGWVEAGATLTLDSLGLDLGAGFGIRIAK